MEADLQQRLDAIEKKVELIYISTEKTRKYFLTVLIVSVVAFVVPLIGLMFAVPSMLSTYGNLMQI